MSAFQACVMPILLLMVARSVVAVVRRQQVMLHGLAIAVWCVGGYFLIFPNDLTLIANMLGIGRGSDLLGYFVAVAAAYAFLNLKSRQWRLERQLTALCRSYAIDHADQVPGA